MNRTLSNSQKKVYIKEKWYTPAKHQHLLRTSVYLTKSPLKSHSTINYQTKIQPYSDSNPIMQELYKSQKKAEKAGQYVEAQSFKRKIKKHKQEQQRKNNENILKKQQDQRKTLEQSYNQQMNNFNIKWEELFNEHLQEVKIIEDKLHEKQQAQIQDSIKQEGSSTTIKQKSFRQSSRLLNLKVVQQQLAKQQKYMKAHQIQEAIQKMEEQQQQTWKKQVELKYGKKHEKILQKHEKQQFAVQLKIKILNDQLKKAKNKELQFLQKKYQNMVKQLNLEQSKQRSKLIKNVKISHNFEEDIDDESFLRPIKLDV